MRQFITIVVTFIGQLSMGYSQTPYKINSCKIDFVFAARSFEKGTKTMIFADSGKVEKEIAITYLDTSANAEIPKEIVDGRTVYHTLLIQTTDSILYIDLDSMTCIKSANLNPRYSSTHELMKKIREDTFLRKKCDVMDFNGIKLWYWKGIVLKKEIPAGGVYEYATSINENYVIKKDEFEVPKNVKILSTSPAF